MAIDIAIVRAQLEGLAREYEATSPFLREEMLIKAKEAAEYAKQLAEQELTHSRKHTTKGGYTNEPGDYARSIEGTVVFEHGHWRGRVIARDWKAAWIEYGTRVWAKHAILTRTASHMRGQS